MAAEEWERLKWRHGAKALRPSCQRSEWEPSALPKGQRNLRTSAPSLSDRFGASLTCPRPHHPLELGLESRASGGARRGLERPPLRHGRRAGERRKRRDAYAGAADNPSPAGRPALAVELRPRSNTDSSFTMPALGRSPRMERIRPAWPRSASASGCRRRFPYLRHGSAGLFVTIRERFLAVVNSRMART
jgi:hypothetical protein